ncbi:unnamed protein product, partial [marine sediment metagenome]
MSMDVNESEENYEISQELEPEPTKEMEMGQELNSTEEAPEETLGSVLNKVALGSVLGEVRSKALNFMKRTAETLEPVVKGAADKLGPEVTGYV